MNRTVLLLVVIHWSSTSCIAAEEIRFSTQIRPILSDKCFQCHGPDAAKRTAGLRLDEETAAKSVLESGATAIVPRNVSASLLMDRITSTDPDLHMPPAESGKTLTDREIGLLKTWIESGAKWGGHWAFEPVRRPEPPDSAEESASSSRHIVNDIDRFINARLQETGLTPNDETGKVALLRRVTLDLTGLPPTPAEVDAFLQDSSPDAYDTVVDYLLQSPRYGEHMARYWLDAARYGDTHGLHLDNFREMWAYRDWVVNAFNDNKPFDEFTIEQLAGDLLPNPTDDQLIATGFNRCHVTTSEGGSIAEEVEVRNTVDRVVTTGAVFMGLTLDCTRCHSHKFDPLTIGDFYSLYGYFNSIDGGPLDGNAKDHAPVIKVLTPDQKGEVAGLESQVQGHRDQIRNLVSQTRFTEPENPSEPVLSAPMEIVWIEDAVPAEANPSGNTPWEFVKAPAPVFSGELSHKRAASGLSQHFFEGAKPPLRIGEGDVFFAYVFLDAADPTKELMLQWNDGTWNHRAYWGGNSIDWGEDNSPSRLRKGDLPKAGEWVRLEVTAADVGLQTGAEVHGWAFTQFDGTVYWDHAGVISRSSELPGYDSFVLWQRDQKAAGSVSLPENLKVILQTADDQRKDADLALLKDYFLEHAFAGNRKVLSGMHREIAEWETKIGVIRNGAATTLVYRELAQPKPAFILNRGEYDQPKDQVERRVPAVLPPLPEGAPNNRLGLAQWLTATNHPLTARVTVNRIWQQFFGTGLVKTAEDFGSQGEQPSHPELLDWLSSEFMRPQRYGATHDWDVKHLVKTIVMSAAYRRAANVSAAAYEKDPANRLLARGPRFRLDAETLRDQALFVSGLLVETRGGPSVKPPQPDGLWLAVGYSGSNTVNFVKDNGPDKVHRRTLYTFIKRTAPPPQMAIMDGPSRESCVLRRERTNSPMQALMLMNDPQFVECARVLAEQTLISGGQTNAERLNWLFRRCLQRSPSDLESVGFLADFEAYLIDWRTDVDAAKRLLSVGEVPSNSVAPTEELAAWTMLANTLLNLDEVVTK